jgi:RNA polymerase sigma factor (sigma-70 family)
MSAYSVTHATLLARLTGEADPSVWREFFDRYGALIRGFARREGLQAADGDDVLQDVLLALTKTMPGFAYDPAKGKFRSYLKTLALHAIFKKRLQNRGPVQLEHLEEATRVAAHDESVERNWEEEWRNYHVRLAMRTIEVEFNPADRRAFERYAVGAEDARTVARELGVSVDQVYQAKSRMVKRLSELIEAQVQDEG